MQDLDFRLSVFAELISCWYCPRSDGSGGFNSAVERREIELGHPIVSHEGRPKMEIISWWSLHLPTILKATSGKKEKNGSVENELRPSTGLLATDGNFFFREFNIFPWTVIKTGRVIRLFVGYQLPLSQLINFRQYKQVYYSIGEFAKRIAWNVAQQSTKRLMNNESKSFQIAEISVEGLWEEQILSR